MALASPKLPEEKPLERWLSKWAGRVGWIVVGYYIAVGAHDLGGFVRQQAHTMAEKPVSVLHTAPR